MWVNSRRRIATSLILWLAVFFFSFSCFAQQSAIQDTTAQPPATTTIDGNRAVDSGAKEGAADWSVASEATRTKEIDRNEQFYYKNRLELSLDTGWLPTNIPFPFDFMVGDSYENPFRYYTLAPTMVSLRWQLGNIKGPRILRGNTELTFSGVATLIPKSSGHVYWVPRTNAESRYFAFDVGMRRNFVPRNWRVTPYFDFRVGIGNINAKGPEGMRAAQGQSMAFTIMLGSGFRYNFTPRVSASLGAAYMHVSNAYLSEPRYEDYGINVYGPMVGINVRLGKQKDRAVESNRSEQP